MCCMWRDDHSWHPPGIPGTEARLMMRDPRHGPVMDCPRLLAGCQLQRTPGTRHQASCCSDFLSLSSSPARCSQWTFLIKTWFRLQMSWTLSHRQENSIIIHNHTFWFQRGESCWRFLCWDNLKNFWFHAALMWKYLLTVSNYFDWFWSLEECMIRAQPIIKLVTLYHNNTLSSLSRSSLSPQQSIETLTVNIGRRQNKATWMCEWQSTIELTTQQHWRGICI